MIIRKIIPAIYTAGVIFFLFGSGSFTYGTERTPNLPFHPGEKLTFEVRWEFVTAGEAVLEILPIEDVNGKKSFHFMMTSKTTPLIDVFYKVRDRIESYTDIGMNGAILYKKKKGGHRKKEISVPFNWKKMEARYVAPGEDWDPIPILENTFDPLSVFYAFRIHELQAGKIIKVPVTDGKKCVIGKATVIRKERIQIKSGQYDTYLVEPDLEGVGGVFEKSKEAGIQIWVTADEKRIPLVFKSKVVVGSFVAELISTEGINQGQP